MIKGKVLLYSVLHLFVDGVCAFAMLGKFLRMEFPFSAVLTYNFLAFVLQMPIGLLFDILAMKRGKESYRDGFQTNPEYRLWKKEILSGIFVCIGVFFAALGAFFSPVLLGIGNAFFHIGGGTGTIQEDFHHERGGKELGIFVAPGALGLFLGGLMGKKIPAGMLPVGFFLVDMMLLFLTGVLLFLLYREKQIVKNMCGRDDGTLVDDKKIFLHGSGRECFMMGICFIVVVFRSYLGFSVSMPWKTGFVAVFISVIAIVLGKAFGGVLAGEFGLERVTSVSLVLAAIGYFFSEKMLFGVAALFFFNMTMPVTLYLLVRRWKEWSGFFFGFLTVALFAGYLPHYFQMAHPVSDRILGALVSICSLVLLLFAMKLTEDTG